MNFFDGILCEIEEGVVAELFRVDNLRQVVSQGVLIGDRNGTVLAGLKIAISTGRYIVLVAMRVVEGVVQVHSHWQQSLILPEEASIKRDQRLLWIIKVAEKGLKVFLEICLRVMVI
jgi:hypothetical protein